jgi:hypothetical protein
MELILGSLQLSSRLGNFQYCIEPESLLLCSQDPSTGLYPESDQSSPYLLILSP